MIGFFIDQKLKFIPKNIEFNNSISLYNKHSLSL